VIAIGGPLRVDVPEDGVQRSAATPAWCCSVSQSPSTATIQVRAAA
jgi:hypothetical protein